MIFIYLNITRSIFSKKKIYSLLLPITDLKIKFINEILKATWLNASSDSLVTYNAAGIANVELPPGSSSDSHKIYVFVQIFDNSGAYTVYNLTSPVIVQINSSLVASMTADSLSSSISAMNTTDAVSTMSSIIRMLTAARDMNDSLVSVLV